MLSRSIESPLIEGLTRANIALIDSMLEQKNWLATDAGADARN